MITSRHPRGQDGYGLIDVLLTVVIGGLVIGGFLTWGLVVIGQQSSARNTNDDSFGQSLASVSFPQDVASSLAAASGVDETGTPRGAGELRDCTGGDAAGGDVLAAMVTPALRRITYVLVPSTEQPGTNELWRRECPNLSETSDATLADPTLSAAPGVAPGQIAPATPGNEGSTAQVATGVLTAASDCPNASGSAQDPLCLTVALTAQVRDRPVPAVLKGTRRTNSYAPPGTEPIPRFTIDPNPPEVGELVTFDGSTSRDPRGGTLTYTWDFGDPAVPNPPPMSNSPVVTATYMSAGLKTVTLTVTNDEVPPVSSSSPAIRTIDVQPRRPEAVFAAVPLPPATKDTPTDILVDLTAFNGATIAGYTWEWGDGTPDDSGTCPGQTTCTIHGVHTYTTTGTYLLRLTVTDSLGESRTVLASLNVIGEVLYVSSAGADVAGCGSSGAPCRQIQFGLVEAQSNAKTLVQVTGGNYARFDVRDGISVEGGYSADFLTPGAAQSTVDASLVGSVYSAIGASSVSAPTTISGLTANGPTGSSQNAQAVVVRAGSSNLTLTDLVVDGGSGPAATGIVVQESSSVTVTDSTVASGTPLGAGESAYGIRAIGGSNVTVVGGSVTASAGVATPDATASPPSTPGPASNGGSGYNATGPSSPGNGGSGGGSGQGRGGDGGRGGQCTWSWGVPSCGGGYGGQNGDGGNGGGGSGGCASVFGCSPGAGNGDSGAGGGRGNGGGPGSNYPAGATDTWVLRDGGPGFIGDRGSGGGGGGGGNTASASGGGGGGGGRGGTGGGGAGEAGTSGGGSFGVYSSNASVTLTNVAVTSAAGGTGGDGSNGGGGGRGGNGAGGGSESCCSAGPGGAGGRGGGGGGGGGAGGGSGGPSIAVYHIGTGTLSVSGGSRAHAPDAAGGAGGAGGPGGPGGSWGGGPARAGLSGNPGNPGNTGLAQPIWDNG